MKKEKELIDLLTKKHLTIGSVESLTAGLFIATLAKIPGASKVIRGGIITYQTNLKVDLLKINKSIIDKYGVVSKEVANEMAFKGHKLLKSDIVVSFTGNAGPTCEKGEAEVGRVYSAIYCPSSVTKLKIFTKLYKSSRNTIRTEVVNDMIDQLIKFVRHIKK